ncbi:MAG: FAD-dependent oxidoreductase, partial [Desulfobacterales bacterium CG23_combo_of_CG06-09_8_20_14_all_52_9]
MSGSTYDVVIIGGGVIGSAVAYNLMRLEPKLKPAVFERDPTYTRASSTLSVANIRVQFSLAQNIRISQYAMEFLGRFAEEMTVRDIRPNVYFRKEGNLFLVDESGRKPASQALALQQELGCRVDWWTPDRIRERYP